MKNVSRQIWDSWGLSAFPLTASEGCYLVSTFCFIAMLCKFRLYTTYLCSCCLLHACCVSDGFWCVLLDVSAIHVSILHMLSYFDVELFMGRLLARLDPPVSINGRTLTTFFKKKLNLDE